MLTGILNDIYNTHYRASVPATSTFMHMALSRAFMLFTTPMINRLGFDWAASLLAFLTTGLIPIPWVFFKWGPYLRSKSPYLYA